jgi:hypothetical protein
MSIITADEMNSMVYYSYGYVFFFGVLVGAVMIIGINFIIRDKKGSSHGRRT